MQQEDSVRFLKHHQGSVRGVAFHPKDRYLFCSGAYDGKVNLYNAQKYEFLQSYSILATTTARRLAVIDVEKGEQILSYDNCAFNGRDRTSLNIDPSSPNMVVCCCVNGKGLTLFDLRMPLPLDFLYEMHSGIIRDVGFLHESWPWCSGHKSLVSVASDGLCKISTIDGRTLHVIDTGESLNCYTPTPEHYGASIDDGFTSLLMFGGDQVSAYVPDVGIQEALKENRESPIWKLRYTAHGSLLYAACDRGIVRRYRRYSDHHGYLGEVFRHTSDIQDMDISPYDEYLVTASKDRSVGVMRLGSPNHGCSEYAELT